MGTRAGGGGSGGRIHQSEQSGFVFALSCQENVEVVFMSNHHQGMMLKMWLFSWTWICWG